ncbi:hypothetical protein L798_09813, partial [Zootermopsis nevadensis]
EVRRRPNSGNACYFSVQNILSSRLISKNLKIKVYKTIILPVVLYGCETWSLTQREEHRLQVFENRVLRRMFEPRREDDGAWRKLHSLYCSKVLDRDTMQNCIIRSARLRWAGHVARIEDSDLPKKIIDNNPGGQRKRGRPKLRWVDGVEGGARVLGCRNWRVVARDRWRMVVEEAKAHIRL